MCILLMLLIDTWQALRESAIQCYTYCQQTLEQATTGMSFSAADGGSQLLY
jgi:hypothetical protein